MSIMPLVVALLLAQSQPQPATQKKADPKPNDPVTLNGCVARESSDSSYTFTDSTGLKYRLSGQNVAKYTGKPVEVVGLIKGKDVKVTGGLWPSPNVAAQAGNMDPGKAAVAALGGGTVGTGRVDLPTLRITRVGLGTGECKE